MDTNKSPFLIMLTRPVDRSYLLRFIIKTRGVKPMHAHNIRNHIMRRLDEIADRDDRATMERAHLLQQLERLGDAGTGQWLEHERAVLHEARNLGLRP